MVEKEINIFGLGTESGDDMDKNQRSASFAKDENLPAEEDDITTNDLGDPSLDFGEEGANGENVGPYAQVNETVQTYMVNPNDASKHIN